ncbi:hypothetical protein [Chryseobacterium sp. G0201]|uniref:hypothetical protein n=1 Tax=Chryseobacterium sp. G0201 TaxID=2487065 RepID=UPI000F5059C1|nr:hypothetical protein [Chryseobacterium sp. G0201]AZA53572.1 hypothetical protein EG348_11405 [Chryseobacterium sp. G0201]
MRVGTFGNVKTYFSSSFNFGEKTIESEELKIQIIGRFSKVISERLGYSDTILIERRTYYAHNPNQKFFILENNNSQYKVAVLEDGAVLKSNNKGLSIRIIGNEVQVFDVLKLIEYSILNRKKLNKKLVPTDYYFGEKSKLSILVNTEDFIQKIIKKESKLVDEIINKEVILLDNGSLRTQISWKNNEFIFAKSTKDLKEDNVYKNYYVIYKVPDFRYYITSFDCDYFLIFNNKNTFTYFDGIEENTSPKINVEKKGWYVFNLVRERLGNRIILYDTTEYFYLYDINKKLLQKIE